MLCELQTWGSFVGTWLSLSLLGLTSLFIMSGSLFYKFYCNPTYEMWLYKSNPRYPKAETVRNEIVQLCKGIWAATLCPAMSLYLGQHGYSKAYCGVFPEKYPELGWGYLLGSFVLCFITIDWFEFFYHRIGHTTDAGWEQHKFHHLFYNPTPFAVIADEYVDQFLRASPLLFYPLIMPINMDMLFFLFVIIFYAYGVYLHWGYETEWPDAHHPIINTAFQHYCHHAVSFKNKPYHTGFFFKLWDQLWGQVYDKECFCVKCEKSKGLRTRERWEKIEKGLPDYSVLLQPSFWLTWDTLSFETAPPDPSKRLD